MRLYHGSNVVIQQIDLAKCKPYKDFGQGFYLTGIKDQAFEMAKRTHPPLLRHTRVRSCTLSSKDNRCSAS